MHIFFVWYLFFIKNDYIYNILYIRMNIIQGIENPQQYLKTHCDRNLLKISYEEKTISEKEFTARGTIYSNITKLTDIYEWSDKAPNKKTAKNLAAKIMIDKLEINDNTNSNNNELLIEIRDLLKIIVNKL